MTTEFDRVFDQMEAPEYPATCDKCGYEATNAEIDQHICNDAPAAPERGERYGFVVFTGRHKILDYHKPDGQQMATADGEDEARIIVRALNAAEQHSTLIAQRERLIEGLRLAVDWMQGKRGGPSEGLLAVQVIKRLEAVLTTSEQEGTPQR